MLLSQPLPPYIRAPKPEDRVYKDECAFSFSSPDSEDGIFICLKHFLSIGKEFLQNYSTQAGTSIFLRYKIEKRFKANSERDMFSSEPKKLALGVPGGFDLPQDRYTIIEHWSLVHLESNSGLDTNLIEIKLPGVTSDKTDLSTIFTQVERLLLAQLHELPDQRLVKAVSRLIKADSVLLTEARAIAIAAWEDDNSRRISNHAETLKQLENGVKVPPLGWKCSKCHLTENLWMNLTDGTILCGRRFWDGSGGNNHAIEHYEITGFPLAVKLGTITPHGGEVFSYVDDAMVLDPNLAQHLAHFGIDIMSMMKSDKTLVELEVEANERLGEWLTLQEAHHPLEARFGPGMTGLQNLGNSCYINSVLQVLFAIPHFRVHLANRLPYYIDQALVGLTAYPPNLPVCQFLLQLAKLGHALTSGLHSWRPLTAEEIEAAEKVDGASVPRNPGVRPLLFRLLIGQKHPEFSTRRQQDAHEFLVHLLTLLDDQKINWPIESSVFASPLRALQFCMEERLECGFTHKVRYSSCHDYTLCLPIPQEAATNVSDFLDYERQRRELEEAGLHTVARNLDPIRLIIPIEACLSAWAEKKRVEDFASPELPSGQKTYALRSVRFKNFPDFLCVQMGKFTLGPDWIPRKLEVEIDLGPRIYTDNKELSPLGPSLDWHLDLRAYRAGGGLQPGEQPLSDGDNAGTVIPPSLQPGPTVDESIVSGMLSMGFSTTASRKAVLRTGSTSLEAATNWLMEHLDDVDLEFPEPDTHLPVAPSGGAQEVLDEGSISTLMAMGFTSFQATNALRRSKNNLEDAANWILSAPSDLDTPVELETTSFVSSPEHQSGNIDDAFSQATDGQGLYELVSFISHMGRSTMDGHYVAHIRRSLFDAAWAEQVRAGEHTDEWIIYNDEQVARSERPPYPNAYLYFFRRLDAPSLT